MTGTGRARSPATLRGRLTAVAVLITAVVLTILLVVFNALLRIGIDGDADDRARSLALTAAGSITVLDGRIDTSRLVGDPATASHTWVFQDERALARAPGSLRVQRAARMAGRSPGSFSDVARDVRLFSVAVRDQGRTVGAVVAAQPLSTHVLAVELALVGSIGLGLLVLAGVGGATWTIVGRALAPVREMTKQAAEWSERDLDRRFGVEPRPDELGELAATFDGLLDRLAASLRHARRMSSELSHELRTPLARIVVELDLLQRRERPPEERAAMYATLARSADEMDRIIAGLMTAARAEVDPQQGRSDVDVLLGHVRTTWAATLASRGVRLVVHPPARPLAAGTSAELLERILAPLLDNAGRFARSEVVVSAELRDGRVRFDVRDDGSGVAEVDRAAIFELGRRGPEGGAGLGLTLARRLARSAGGEIEYVPSDAGAHFRVEVPA